MASPGALVAADDSRCPVSHSWWGIAASYRQTRARSRGSIGATVVSPSIVPALVHTPVAYSVAAHVEIVSSRLSPITLLAADVAQAAIATGCAQILVLQPVFAPCTSKIPLVPAKFSSADLSEYEDLLLLRSGSDVKARTTANERAGRENPRHEESRETECWPKLSHVSPSAEQHSLTDKLPIDSSWKARIGSSHLVSHLSPKEKAPEESWGARKLPTYDRRQECSTS